MPVYDYKCKDHGLFYELATMSEAHQPAACPQCHVLSPRVICIAPEALAMPEEQRHAHTVNERAQHEPVVSSKERREQDHQHRQGCGCQHKKRGRSLIFTANGEKMFPSMRPWMISH